MKQSDTGKMLQYVYVGSKYLRIPSIYLIGAICRGKSYKLEL